MFFYKRLFLAAVIAGSFATLQPAAAEDVAVNGTVLTYTSEGAGEPILFLHGAITDMRVWEAYRTRISENRRFIAYNQRYFGTGDWPDDGKNFQILTHTDDLIGLIETLDIAPVNLVSHSYAGMVATHAMLKRPDLFRSVIHYEPSVDGLIETMPGGATATREQSSNYGLVGAAIRDGRLEDASLRFFEAVSRTPKGEAEKLPEPLPTMLRENGRTIPLFIKKASAGLVTCQDLGVLKMPTLVVYGQNTFSRYAMQAEEIARCQRRAIALVRSGATHTFPVTNPDEFAEIVVKFLDLLDMAD
jgi:pimeloyl-ACP methyl ester carboxylesterase